MSTWCTIYCVDCKEELHGGSSEAPRCDTLSIKDLGDVIANRGKLEGLAGMGIHMKLDCGAWLNLEWMKAHAGHALRIRDGYGDFVGQCGKEHVCTCTKRLRCSLPAGHVGGCESSGVAFPVADPMNR